MTKSELMFKMVSQYPHIHPRIMEDIIKTMLEHITKMLIKHHRVEIRGFGSFTLHYRTPRIGRNPRTGDQVDMPGRYVPHFKPGKEMRERVNGC